MNMHSVQNVSSSHLLSKNVNIKIYKIITLLAVLYGCETWPLTLREECRLLHREVWWLDANVSQDLAASIFRFQSWGCLRTGRWGQYLDLRERKYGEDKEDRIMNFIPCTIRNILFGWWNQGGWEGGTAHMGEMRNA